MTTEQLDTAAAFASFDDTVLRLLKQLFAFNEKELNTVVFEGRWTAAQVADHLVKSISSITELLQSQGSTTTRQPDEREPELKALFLDVNRRFTSAPALLPTQDFYAKKPLLDKLQNAAAEMKAAARKADLSETIVLPFFNEITKLEILYLSVYHAQKHIYQLQELFEN